MSVTDAIRRSRREAMDGTARIDSCELVECWKWLAAHSLRAGSEERRAVDILTENWNRLLDTVLDWAPQLEYHSTESQNVPELAFRGENIGQQRPAGKIGIVSQ
jgi:hypothetical protein